MDREQPAPQAHRRAWLVAGVLLAALLVHALWAASRKVTCDDLWWDLAAGRYIVEHGEIPAGDPFSYTHLGDPWHNGEWLAHVVFYALHVLGGGTALALAKFAFIAFVFGVIAWTAWRRSDSYAFAILAAILATYACRQFFDIRSQLFQFSLVAVTLAVIEAYRRGGRDLLLLALPLLSLVWVNVHYSFVYGIGMMGLYAGCELAKMLFGLPDRPLPRARALKLAAAVAAACMAWLINPFGIHALTFEAGLVGAESLWVQDVLEWQPPILFADADLNPAFFGWLLVLQGGAAVGALIVNRRRFDLSDTALMAVNTFLAFSSRRFIPLFAVVGVPFLAKNLAVLFEAFAATELRQRANAVIAALAAIATVLLVVRAIPEWQETYRAGFFAGVSGLDYFPVGATELLHRNPLPARLFHPYTYGGYIMFNAPERKVFIDGRANTIYHADFYIEEQTAENGRPGWEQVLDQREVSLVVWPSSMAHGERLAALHRLLAASRNWVRVYDDGHTAAFAHTERGREWIAAQSRRALVYPDVAGAQEFLFNAYMNANDFEGARRQIGPALERHPHTRAQIAAAEEKFAALAAKNDSPQIWFALGFFRDVRGDQAGAAAAFREALARGLAEPNAVAYARKALGADPRPTTDPLPQGEG